MASGVQKLSSEKDACWHRDVHHNGNNGVCTVDQSEPLFTSNLTTVKVFSTDNLNYNVTQGPLIRNNIISQEVCELTLGAVLNYISQILLEEDLDDDTSPEEAALRDTEKSFYDILGKDYLSDGWPQIHRPQNTNTTESAGSTNTTNWVSNSGIPSYNKGVEDNEFCSNHQEITYRFRDE
jgi:hypothetical protein